MTRLLATVAIALVAVVCVSSALAATGGSFSKGIFAKYDDKAGYISGRNVWCAWSGNHVVVHVTLQNSSIETITATVKPRYYIARGGEHGSGFLSGVDFKLRGGATMSKTMDAGAPKGTPTGAAIARCAPYLYLVD
jgi:hypothetical protein